MSRAEDPTTVSSSWTRSPGPRRTPVLAAAVAALIAAAACDEPRRPVSGPAPFRGFDFDASGAPDAPLDVAVDGPASSADARTTPADARIERDAGPPDAVRSDAAAAPPPDLAPIPDVPVADLPADRGGGQPPPIAPPT